MSYLEELLPEFRKGAKIRSSMWSKKAFIHLKDGKILDETGLPYTIPAIVFHINDWEFYQEPIDWDCIIKKKCLCWFWDEWFGAACIGILGEIYKGCDLKYVLRDKNEIKNGNQSQFRNCRPVCKDEVTFYEDKEL